MQTDRVAGFGGFCWVSALRQAQGRLCAGMTGVGDWGIGLVREAVGDQLQDDVAMGEHVRR